MKASEAMILGSTLIEPRQGTLFGVGSKSPGCALAMMCEAVSLKRRLDIMVKHFPILMIKVPQPCSCDPDLCCDCGEDTGKVANIIIHLFDDHVRFTGDLGYIPGMNDNGELLEEWTVERIAEWLGSLESKLPVVASPRIEESAEVMA